MRANSVGIGQGEVLDVVLDALATYRITRLVVEDEITAQLRDMLWDRYDPSDTKIGYLVTCPWCVSFWAGLGVVAVRAAAPRQWSAMAQALAFSAAAGIVAHRL